MTMLDYALDYAKRGWAVFPLVEKDKIPLTSHGFLDAVTDETQIRSWWTKHPKANIGIATGQKSGGLVVIDIDINEEKGKHGDEVFEEWQEENGCYIDSLTAITGTGGKHYYFTSSEPFNSAAGYFEDIDVRADGGYVVAPGSIHPNGKEYFFDDEDEEIVCVQEDSDVELFLHEYFKAGNKFNKDKKKLEIPEKITKDRNNFLIKLQGKLAEENLYTAEEIKAQILTINQTRCEPPLSEEELERTIFKSTDKWVEKAKTEKKRKKTEEEPKVDANKLEFPELTKAKEYEEEDLPEQNNYVGVDEEVPFLVEGTCILSAKSKLGKSWLSLELCDAVTKGNDFLGYKTKKCSAVYFDFETGKKVRQNRLKKLTKIVGPKTDTFYIVEKAYRIKEGFEEQLEHYMQMDPDIGVVVVDVFTKIVKPKPKDVNDYEYYYDLISKLNEISHKYHISIVLVCHDRKTVDPSDPFANILGSTALQGATDQMIVMFKMHSYNDSVTHISVKGRTLDGIIDMDAQMKEGLWVRAENVAALRKCDEYKKSAIYAAVKNVMDKNRKWRGRCGQFAQYCEEIGFDLELPLDKTNSKDFRPIGKAFLDVDFQNLLKDEGIDIEVSNPNSTGGRIYTLTVSTVSKEWDTVSENDENPYE